ncbi:MAG TPA: hypothetical protein VL199_13245 [Burkholderiales bacterium]|nr:hypothetical protein [Burkholderiales bacterium]
MYTRRAMLKWLRTKEVDAFADSVVSELTKRVPLDMLRKEGGKADKRFHRMTDVISDQVRAFGLKERPNVYQRARLGNRVKWALKDAGYPEPFIDAFTTELVTLVTVATKSAK